MGSGFKQLLGLIMHLLTKLCINVIINNDTERKKSFTKYANLL